MKKMIFIVVLLITIPLSSCNQAIQITPLPTITSGIEGNVTEGPMCPGPVPAGDNPCPDQPYQTIITVFDSNQKQVALIQTDNEGNFKVPLHAGTYVLHPEPGKPFPVASDQIVEVNDGEYTQVTITYDTGMR